MRKIFFAALTMVVVCNNYAQDGPTDSLKARLSGTSDLKAKYQLLYQISRSYFTVGTGENYVQNSLEMVRIAIQLKDDSLIAKSYNTLGDFYSLIKGDHNTALDYFFKGIPYAERSKNNRSLASLYLDIGIAYWSLQNYPEELRFTRKAEASMPDVSHPDYNYLLLQLTVNYAVYYLSIHALDLALSYIKSAEETNQKLKFPVWDMFIKTLYGGRYLQSGDYKSADVEFKQCLAIDSTIQLPWAHYVFRYNYINFLIETNRFAEAITQTNELMLMSKQAQNNYFRLTAIGFLKTIFDKQARFDSAYYYAKQESALKDTVFDQQLLNKLQALNFNEEMRKKDEEDQRRQKTKTFLVVAGFLIILIIASILYFNARRRKKANAVLTKTLSDLKATQSQLIQAEKMASLGELTAGIAHEIQNPLNFVNNFSELNAELIDELDQGIEKGNLDDVKLIAKDIKENELKISHHGKRADAIVKGMLQHSRTSSGQKEPTDINELCDEYVRLAFHGLRAKDKTFNAKFETDFDPSIGKINVVSQDVGRVILNLINNAFYAVSERQKAEQATGNTQFEPTVMVSTKKISTRPGDSQLEIRVRDNGTGIPQRVLDKIFQPFFTTKPTGIGTGLGLSLSYDIIKGHGGEIKVETEVVQAGKEGGGTEFIVRLPGV